MVLRRSLDRIVTNTKNTKELHLALVYDLLVEDMLYNIIEENYLKWTKVHLLIKELGKSLIDLRGSLTESKFKLALENLTGFIKKYRDIVGTSKSFAQAQERTLYLPGKISLKYKVCAIDGPLLVAGFRYPFLFDLDSIICDKLTSRIVGDLFKNKIDEVKQKYNISKLCFIEKRYGAVGALLLLSELVKNSGCEAMIYRPRHWNTLCQIYGKRPKKGEKICLIYDLAFTGGALYDAAMYLQGKPFNAKVPSAIVLYDYGFTAREKLSTIGVSLESLITFSYKEFREKEAAEYSKALEELRSLWDQRKITFEEYNKKSLAILRKYAPLGFLHAIARPK